MKRILLIAFVAALPSGAWVLAQSSEPSLPESFRMVEVASVSDAMEQLYGTGVAPVLNGERWKTRVDSRSRRW